MEPERNLYEQMARQAAERERAEKQAAAARARAEQIEAGRCSLVPYPVQAKKTVAPFRSELTVEQASLFVSNQYRGRWFQREWNITHPETGEPIIQRLTVGRLNDKDEPRGVLRQVHQDVLYKLKELWEQRSRYGLGEIEGKRYGAFTISAYELVMTIRGSDCEADYQRVQSLIADLAAIPIVLENAYTERGLEDQIAFTLLHGFDWQEKSVDKQTRRPKLGGKSEVTICFSAKLTEGFLAKHVKTLLGGPYRSLQRSTVAKLLYPFLDGQLATKDEYRSKLAPLAERWGYTSKNYKKKAERRRRFEPAVRLLDGKPIQGERYLLRVELADSADKEDCMLVATREGPRQLSLPLPAV